MFFAVVATSRTRVCSNAMCCRAGKLEAMRFKPQRVVPAYVSPPANPTRSLGPPMPPVPRRANSLRQASLLRQGSRSVAASLRVLSGTYGQGGAGKASEVPFWSCELVQRHTRTSAPAAAFSVRGLRKRGKRRPARPHQSTAGLLSAPGSSAGPSVQGAAPPA